MTSPEQNTAILNYNLQFPAEWMVGGRWVLRPGNQIGQKYIKKMHLTDRNFGGRALDLKVRDTEDWLELPGVFINTPGNTTCLMKENLYATEINHNKDGFVYLFNLSLIKCANGCLQKGNCPITNLQLREKVPVFQTFPVQTIGADLFSFWRR